MPNILTLTMNPALDIATSTDKVMDTHKMRCGPAIHHPGGGGINVARVVHRLGGDCLALFPAGGVTGQRLQQLLAAENVPGRPMAIAGETRESFSVFESSSGRDYRFVLPGPMLSEAEWRICLAEVDALLKQGGVRHLIVSGSLPPGVPVDFCAQLADVARSHGSRMVVDTSGAPLAAADRAIPAIADALGPLTGQLQLALVFGSVAKGTDHAGSDVDVLVVSDSLSLQDLLTVLLPMEERIARRVEIKLYTEAEFGTRRKESGSVVSRIIAEPHMILYGSV